MKIKRQYKDTDFDGAFIGREVELHFTRIEKDNLGRWRLFYFRDDTSCSRIINVIANLKPVGRDLEALMHEIVGRTLTDGERDEMWAIPVRS